MYDYALCTNELMHYGVKGMHWGIRRYQPYPDGSVNGKFVGRRKMAKQAKRVLNYNDKQETVARYNRQKSAELASFYKKKAANTNSARKKQKFLAKADKETQDYNTWQSRINNGRKATQDTIRAMGKQGFATQKSLTSRQVNKGKDFVASLLMSLGPVVMVKTTHMTGTKYNVKDTRKMTSEQIRKLGEKNARTVNILKDVGAMEKKANRERDLNSLKQTVNQVSNKSTRNDDLTPEQEMRETRAFGKILSSEERRKYNDYTSKIDKAENDYLNISEDYTGPRDANYEQKLKAARKKHDDLMDEYIRWRNGVSKRVF